MSHISTIYMLWRWAKGVHMQGSDYIIGLFHVLVMKALGTDFYGYFYLPAIKTRGGILVAWISRAVWMSNVHLSDNCVTFLVSPSVEDYWLLDKVAFLDEMRDVLLGH